MKRILFVDDDPRILSGLRRMLRGRSKEWAMEFAIGPDAALLLMSERSFDLVVSDMRMPGMTGAQLLHVVQQRNPAAIRIILSGESELESIMRAVGVAHQFLTKPCDPQVLQDTLARALALHDLLDSEDLRSQVSAITSLPSPPKVYQAVTTALADPNVDIDEVVKLVRVDIGLYAKTLQIVNSSFFGLARQLTDLKQAVTYLGLETLKDVILGAEVFRQFESAGLPQEFDLAREQEHGVITSKLARSLIEDRAVAESAFTAAMLHDIGKCVLATRMPDEFVRVHRLCQTRPPYDPERVAAESTHARLGGYLLGLWGLPYPIVEAVTFHHKPSAVCTTSFGALGAVHVANCLAGYAAAIDDTARARALEELDLEYLTALGLQDSVPVWCELAHELAEKTD